MATHEDNDLQNELCLLKEEYIKLQEQLTEVELKYEAALASDNIEGNGNDTYSNSLIKFVSNMFDNNQYSDIKIVVEGERILTGHRLILSSRSNDWCSDDLDQVNVLDLSALKYEVAYAMIKWVYTDQLNTNVNDSILVELLQAATTYNLQSLNIRCQEALISSIDIRNCKKLLQVSQELSALQLKDHCLNFLKHHKIVDPQFRVKQQVKENNILIKCEVVRRVRRKKQNETETCQTEDIKKKPYVCTECSKRYNTQKALKKHSRLHTGGQLHKCTFCDEKFSRNNQLQEHLTIHTGKRPHQCDVCDRPFNNKHALEAHGRIHSGEKPFFCDVCGKAFRQAGSLTTHKRTHSGEKPYQCELCAKSFSQRFNLHHHIQTHTQERRHMCDICGRAFVNPSNLSQHIQIHVGQKKFTCNECGKSFLFNKYLTKHKKIHTRRNSYIIGYNQDSYQDNSTYLPSDDQNITSIFSSSLHY